MSQPEPRSLSLVAVAPAACEFTVTDSQWDDISIVVWNETNLAAARERVAAFARVLATCDIDGIASS